MKDFGELIKSLGHLKAAEMCLERAAINAKGILGVVDFGHLVDIAKEISDYMAMNVDLDDHKPTAQNQAMPVVSKAAQKPRARLTEDNVRAIIGLLHSGCSQSNIARRFKVGPSCIYKIAHGETWQHIERPKNFMKKAKFTGTISFAA